MLNISVVDYGASNLLNVVHALEHCGVSAKIVDSEKDIKKADRLVLPGVGAFREGMNALKEKNLIEGILDFIASERPYLGICLGMQFLFEESHEFGATKGFGVFQGEVLQIPSITTDNQKRRVPHIGWNALHHGLTNTPFSSPLLKDISEGESFYFVHSYMCVPKDNNVISSSVDYLELEIPASVSYNNIHGTQFHPEKSGESGLRILRNFLEI